MTLPAMNEVLCGRLPALLVSPDLRRTLAFYRDDWGFDVQHHIPGVIALVTRAGQLPGAVAYGAAIRVSAKPGVPAGARLGR